MTLNTLILSNKQKSIYLKNLINKIQSENIFFYLPYSVPEHNTQQIADLKCWHLLVIDTATEGFREFAAYFRKRHPMCCLITITENHNMEKMVFAADIGAWDYLVLPQKDKRYLSFCLKSALTRINRWFGIKSYR